VAGSVTLAGDELPATTYLVRAVDALHPSRVARLAGDRVLVITAAASPAALATALDAGISVLVTTDHTRGHLIDNSGVVHHLAPPPPPQRPHRRPGKPPWGRIAVVIAMLTDRQPRTQVDLAREAGITQPNVAGLLSQVPWVRWDTGGWSISDVDAALAWLVDAWRAPTITATWLTLDPPVRATKAVAALLEEQGVQYAVTGPVAADFLAPWENPRTSVIWADRLPDLTDAGCVSSTSGQATVTIAVPDDPRALQSTRIGGVDVADPWRVWLALTTDGHTQAADHLRAHLLR
jgi:hypothetical protein